jgi:hypothetical protein
MNTTIAVDVRRIVQCRRMPVRLWSAWADVRVYLTH